MSVKQVYSTAFDNHYSYVNEDLIDSDLKCTVCGRPFIKPIVGKKCGHTFCQTCINNWNWNQRELSLSCPVCRTITSYEPLTTRVVLSQLDRLLVRCSYCYENNIQRGNFTDHIQHQCQELKVRCKAADLKCTWIGKRNEVAEHASVCPLVQIRPIIEELRATQNALKLQLETFINEIRDRLYNQQHEHVLYKTNDQNKNNKDHYETIKKDIKHSWIVHQHQSWWEERNCTICMDCYRYLRKCLVCSCTITPKNIHFYDNFHPTVSNFICKTCVTLYS